MYLEYFPKNYLRNFLKTALSVNNICELRHTHAYAKPTKYPFARDHQSVYHTTFPNSYIIFLVALPLVPAAQSGKAHHFMLWRSAKWINRDSDASRVYIVSAR